MYRAPDRLYEIQKTVKIKMSIVCPIGEKNIGHPNKIFNKSGTRYVPDITTSENF
jgi:hypothetical protein